MHSNIHKILAYMYHTQIQTVWCHIAQLALLHIHDCIILLLMQARNWLESHSLLIEIRFIAESR